MFCSASVFNGSGLRRAAPSEPPRCLLTGPDLQFPSRFRFTRPAFRCPLKWKNDKNVFNILFTLERAENFIDFIYFKCGISPSGVINLQKVPEGSARWQNNSSCVFPAFIPVCPLVTFPFQPSCPDFLIPGPHWSSASGTHSGVPYIRCFAQGQRPGGELPSVQTPTHLCRSLEPATLSFSSQIPNSKFSLFSAGF